MLQVMDELGLVKGFLKLPHQHLPRMGGMDWGAASIWWRPAPMWGLAHQMRRWPKGANMF
jgi:hypothetical protein